MRVAVVLKLCIEEIVPTLVFKMSPITTEKVTTIKSIYISNSGTQPASNILNSGLFR